MSGGRRTTLAFAGSEEARRDRVLSLPQMITYLVRVRVRARARVRVRVKGEGEGEGER